MYFFHHKLMCLSHDLLFVWEVKKKLKCTNRYKWWWLFTLCFFSAFFLGKKTPNSFWNYYMTSDTSILFQSSNPDAFDQNLTEFDGVATTESNAGPAVNSFPDFLVCFPTQFGKLLLYSIFICFVGWIMLSLSEDKVNYLFVLLKFVRHLRIS